MRTTIRTVYFGIATINKVSCLLPKVARYGLDIPEPYRKFIFDDGIKFLRISNVIVYDILNFYYLIVSVILYRL